MQAVTPDTRNMKLLLALVIIMGVLIVVGLVVVVVTIANRLSGPDAAEQASPRVPFDTVELSVPPGCQIVETVAADDRLILWLGTGERCARLLVVDLATGQLLGTLRLVETTQ
jgi:hypothetical protein